jgi:hypothetical protein
MFLSRFRETGREILCIRFAGSAISWAALSADHERKGTQQGRFESCKKMIHALDTSDSVNSTG